MDKHEIRSHYRGKRQVLDPVVAGARAKHAAPFLKEFIGMRHFSHVALYAAFDGEISCEPLAHFLLREGKKIYFPRVHHHGLEFYRVDDMKSLIPNRHGVLEPPHDLNAIADKQKIELVVVPGIAFDKRGTRIGFGNGHYDRFLSDYSGVKIGLAYEFQILDEIENKPWDVAMNYIVTERKMYRI